MTYRGATHIKLIISIFNIFVRKLQREIYCPYDLSIILFVELISGEEHKYSIVIFVLFLFLFSARLSCSNCSMMLYSSELFISDKNYLKGDNNGTACSMVTLL